MNLNYFMYCIDYFSIKKKKKFSIDYKLKLPNNLFPFV